MKNRKLRISKILLLFCILHFVFYLPAIAQKTSEYVKEAWVIKSEGKFDQVHKITDECIEKFSAEADNLARSLYDFPSKEEKGIYQVMNDIAVCYFIKGETLRDAGMALRGSGKEDLAKATLDEAIRVLREVIKKYPYAQAFDAKGPYWSIKEKSEIIISQIINAACEIDEYGICKDNKNVNIIKPQTKVKLYDRGAEFPINYSKYGEFLNVGTKDYEYIINDPVGLAKAAGEGIYPNSTSIKLNPEFAKLKKTLSKINHWEILNSRDLNTAFYKWNLAPEPEGVRLFYKADILERSGDIEHAIKAYYAMLVHFPTIYSWTYWHTPWYPAKAALYRIKHLLRQNPQLGFKLEGASLIIVNGYDNDITNDAYVTNPGRLVKVSLEDKAVSNNNICSEKPRNFGKIIKALGGNKVKLVKYENGDWQLLVNGKPFMIKGITYGPTRVGESPDKGTLQNWTTQDINQNGLIDSPFEAWIDKNKNNVQDSDEKPVGDFSLLKEMGANTLRLYHQTFKTKLDKKVLRKMHSEYGIYVVMGDFIGKYALGSGANWKEGTDYDNPVHRENMLNSVKEMVLDFKDEPYILMWLLGNENIYGFGCNADKKPESFFKFVNEASLLIKLLDTYKRPVAIASGDTLYLDIFAENCPDVDIFGTNAYRGKHGFLDFWAEVKRIADIPAMVTEYGSPAYGQGYPMEEAEHYQAEYHKNCWQDIYCNSGGYEAGNSIGGFVFEWLDEWWKAYEPFWHDIGKLSAGPFLGGYYVEEWFGLTGQGNGKNSPYLRQLRKGYYTYKKLWNE